MLRQAAGEAAAAAVLSKQYNRISEIIRTVIDVKEQEEVRLDEANIAEHEEEC